MKLPFPICFIERLDTVTAFPSTEQALYCLFACLGLLSHSRDFHSYGDVTITCEWLQILICARHQGLSRLELELPIFRLRGKRSKPLRHSNSLTQYIKMTYLRPRLVRFMLQYKTLSST